MWKTKGSISSVTTKLLEQLECPVCLETSATPIFSCVNGHPVCGKCNANLQQCGVCRAPGKPFVRCLSLENIAKLVLPCKNMPYGCKLEVALEEMGAHTALCKFKLNAYCIHCADWRGPTIRSFMEHLRVFHKAKELTSKVTGRFDIGTSIFKFCSPNILDMVMLYDGTYFWLRMEFNPPTNLLSCSVRLISNQTADPHWHYAIEFKEKNTSRRIYVTQEVSSLKDEPEACTNIFIPKRYIVDADKNVCFLTIRKSFI